LLQVLLKGTFVCAYVGERVSEEDLQLQEEIKLTALRSANISPSSQSSTTTEESSAENLEKGYVTYAFQIHDGSDVVNIDSE
jgi:hypothetical protein